MSFERDEKMLQEYTEWVLLQRSKDTSPATFLLDKGKEDAFQKLIEGIDFIELYATDGPLKFKDMRVDDVKTLYSILKGDDA